MSRMKKVLLMCTAYVLVAALAIGGTIAYLQDSDSDVNVMTLGNVKIEQHEYERVVNADGTFATATIDGMTSYVLKEFTQGKALLPSAVVVSSTPWDSTTVRMSQVDSYGGMQTFLPVTNAQDKFVTVENTGKTDAYIRTLVAIEVGTANPDLISFGNHFTWKDNQIGIITIDGNNYYLHEFTYDGYAPYDRHVGGILPAGDTSYPSLSQVYIKPEATNEDMVDLDGNGNGTLDILVISQAVQVAGFANAETALNAAFGDITTDNHPWADGANIPVTVFSAADAKAAIDAGEKDIIVKGATFTESLPVKADVNITFVDCTITGASSWKCAKNATFTNCVFDCGSDNAAIHFDMLYGELVVNNCTFKSGKIQIGTNGEASAIFNNCVFGETTTTSIWAEKGMRFYCPTEFNNCEFNNRVVLAGSNGLSITFDSCTMNGGTPVYYVDNTDGIIRGGNVPVVTIK